MPAVAAPPVPSRRIMPGHQTPVQDIVAQHFQASSIRLVWSVLEKFLWVIIVSGHRTAKTFLWVPL